MDFIKNKWGSYRYKNLSFTVLSLVVAYFLFSNEFFHSYLLHLGNLGYIGAFIAGILFVSTFTVASAGVILFILAETLSPLEIGLIAGVGAVIGDLFIFQFIKNKGLISEIKHFFTYLGGDKVSHLFHSKYFAWSLPVMGAVVIASPLPDELGIGLMGISRLSTFKFILVSFILNSIGIFLIVSASILIA